MTAGTMSNPGSKRARATYAVAGACVGLVASALITAVVMSRRNQRHIRARAEVSAMEQSLSLGLSKADTRRTFDAGGHTELTCQCAQESNTWVLSTPFEWGSSNWLLGLDFDDGGLAAIRYFTADGMHMRPQGVNPDRFRDAPTAR